MLAAGRVYTRDALGVYNKALVTIKNVAHTKKPAQSGLSYEMAPRPGLEPGTQ